VKGGVILLATSRTVVGLEDPLLPSIKILNRDLRRDSKEFIDKIKRNLGYLELLRNSATTCLYTAVVSNSKVSE
jgi:hypothetical protein